MSHLERKPGRVIFTRPGQTPILYEGLYYTFLLMTGLSSVAMLLIEPLYAAFGAMFFGVGAMAMGLVATAASAASGGRLLAVRRRFEVVSPTTGDGYRDAPSEPELRVEGRSFPQSKVREVVLGRFSTHNAGATIDFWPVYIVLEDHVVELAVLRDKADALKLRREIAELFDVPMRETVTGRFGEMGVGCLMIVAMIGVDLVALMLPLVVLIYYGIAAVPVPALVALLMWSTHRASPRLFGKKFRDQIDDEVARAFELTGPRVRISEVEESAVEVPVVGEKAAHEADA